METKFDETLQYVQALEEEKVFLKNAVSQLQRLDGAHSSLAPKPPAGARPHDIVVRFHYYKMQRRLLWPLATNPVLNTRVTKSSYSVTSPLRPITSHLQLHKVPYYWGFLFRLNVTKDGVQHVPHDLLEGDAFLKRLGLDLPPHAPLPAPSKIWTPVRGRRSSIYSTPQQSHRTRLHT